MDVFLEGTVLLQGETKRKKADLIFLHDYVCMISTYFIHTVAEQSL